MDGLVAFAATYLLFVVAAGAVLAWVMARRPDRVPFAVAGVVAAAVVGILVKVAGMVWTDPRPFVVDHVRPIIQHGVDNGFPSDHTALAFAVSLVVLTRNRTVGLVLLVVSAVLGAARVAALVHHVPDILAGVLIGVVAAGVGLWAARHTPRRFTGQGPGAPTTAGVTGR